VVLSCPPSRVYATRKAVVSTHSIWAVEALVEALAAGTTGITVSTKLTIDFNLTGLSRGGQQIQKSRDTYVKAVGTLVELASLQVSLSRSSGPYGTKADIQTAFTILDEVIRATNRRVNAIEHVIIPRLDNTIKYINSELDEMDRYVLSLIPLQLEFPTYSPNLLFDSLFPFHHFIPGLINFSGTVLTASEEFFRLKKVQGKKKRDAEKTLQDRSEQNADFEAEGGKVHRDEGVGGGAGGGGDMLDEGKDEDVIF
jgi:V-type H+-transporting ATPase subunit D